MTILHDHVEPGERVPWQSTTYREAMWQLLRGSGIAVAMLAFELFLADEIFFSALFGGFVIYMATTTVWRGPAEMFLTDRRFLVRTGTLRPHVTAVDRKDVERLEIYDGDETVVLHGRDGERLRTAIIGDAAELMEIADLPVTLWRSRWPERAFNLVASGLAIGLVILCAIGVAAAFALVIGVAGEPPSSGLRTAITLVVGSWWLFTAAYVGLLAISALFVTGIIAGLLRLALSTEELRCLRCGRHDPRWLGKDPRSPFYRVRLVRLVRSLRATFGRLAYGRVPDCSDIEPEHFGPGEHPEGRGEA